MRGAHLHGGGPGDLKKGHQDCVFDLEPTGSDQLGYMKAERDGRRKAELIPGYAPESTVEKPVPPDRGGR